jgi:hypothetical protein
LQSARSEGGTGGWGSPVHIEPTDKGERMLHRRSLIIIGTVFLSIFFMASIAMADSIITKKIGQIKNMTGDVTIIRGGTEYSTQIGDLLESQDTVITGADSSVGITFIDNSRFSLGPKSRIELTKFKFDPTTNEGEFNTTVQKGTLLILSGQIAKESPDAMKVKTKNSILGVRGTRFAVRVR